ncbi:MAG: type II secretion protein F [Clostridiales bacterium 43-6]|nr:MAG: type II secretion protein F [Clostridiales bacterium 43-6]
MPEFRYLVADSSGQTIRGTIQAENESICRQIISKRGLYCLELTQANLASKSLSFGGAAKFKVADLNIFCRQFSTMLSSGISIVKCLDILAEQTENPKLKAVVKNVYEEVQKGRALSSAMKAQEGAFPDVLISMVESGEMSGNLDVVFVKIAAHYEKDQKTANKVKSAMVYPIVLGCLTVGVVTILLVFVMPTFLNMFKQLGAELPMMTKVLLAISNFLTGYWYIVIGGTITIGIAWNQYIKTESGRMNWDTRKLKLPIVGKMNVAIGSARFSRTLSTVMQSGIPLLRALDVTAKVLNNKFYEKHLMTIKEDIRKGSPLSASIKKAEIFPSMLYSMISIGEESGTLDTVLEKTANFFDEEADNKISKTVSMLEPLMIVLMAGIVGFIIIAIITPVYSMMNAIK